ncbi:hypothetical protein HOY80DRAFT_156409 [Tuber brumale]|nr:hypothetical protein HOY80DRAFT_156409 [Tuber brumale]
MHAICFLIIWYCYRVLGIDWCPCTNCGRVLKHALIAPIQDFWNGNPIVQAREQCLQTRICLLWWPDIRGAEVVRWTLKVRFCLIYGWLWKTVLGV